MGTGLTAGSHLDAVGSRFDPMNCGKRDWKNGGRGREEITSVRAIASSDLSKEGQ